MCELQSQSSSSSSSSLWVRFTGYDAPHFEPGDVVVQFHRATRREFSPVVRATAPFQFSSTIDCRLHAADRRHAFALYALKPCAVNSTNSATALFRFSIDAAHVHEQLQSAPQQTLSLSVTSETGIKLAYEASLQPPLYVSTEDASVLSAMDDDIVSVSTSDSRLPLRPVDLSFSSVSEEGDSADDDSPLAGDSFLSKRSKRHSKVRFSDTLQFIPTTQQLKRDADNAAAERASLSRCLGDLASQMAQMQQQLRQVKQSVANANEQPSVQPTASSAKRRRVVIDGHSIACSYGRGKFKPHGISVALQYYHSRGFVAVAVISKRVLEFGKSSRESSRDAVLAQLIDSGLVAVSNSHSRKDEFMLRYALDHNAYVVSNERLQASAVAGCSKREKRRIQTFLDSHRIPFMFIANEFVPTSPTLRPSKSSDCLRRDSL